MHRLGASLFDELRSYLTFREIHAKRVINSKWNYIEEVPKVFRLEQNPPGRACFKKIIRFDLGAGHQLSVTTIDRILSESRSNLQLLCLCQLPNDMDFIPGLPNLKYFANIGLAHPMAEGLLRKCPKLSYLLHNLTPSRPLEVDLLHLKAMKHIKIFGFSGFEQAKK